MKVSIVGTPGCGRTVFMGLLHETLVRFTTVDENQGDGEMRFITEPQVTKDLGDIRLDLLSGSWPDRGHGERISGCTIELGFRRSWFSRLLSSGTFNIVTVRYADIEKRDAIAIENMSRTLGTDPAKAPRSLDLGVLSEGLLDALYSHVIVLLVDSSNVLTKGREGEMKAKEADAFYAALLEVMMQRKSTRYDQRTFTGRPHLFIFLTKFDLVGYDLSEKDGAGKPGLIFLEEHYPVLFKAIRGYRSNAGPFPAEVLISWTRTETDENGAPAPSPITDHGQVKIDYPYDEFASLIKLLGRLAKAHPKKSRERFA